MTSLGFEREGTARHLNRTTIYFGFTVVHFPFLFFFQPLNWKKFTLKYRLSSLIYSCCKGRVSSRMQSIVTSFQVIFAATRNLGNTFQLSLSSGIG